MTQNEALKRKLKSEGDLAEMWRGTATRRYNEKRRAQELSLILGVFLLVSNGGWFFAFMWIK